MGLVSPVLHGFRWDCSPSCFILLSDRCCVPLIPVLVVRMAHCGRYIGERDGYCVPGTRVPGTPILIHDIHWWNPLESHRFRRWQGVS